MPEDVQDSPSDSDERGEYQVENNEGSPDNPEIDAPDEIQQLIESSVLGDLDSTGSDTETCSEGEFSSRGVESLHECTEKDKYSLEDQSRSDPSLSRSSSLPDHSDRLDSIIDRLNDAFTITDAATKYVAGYISTKCCSKFECEVCESFTSREDKSFQENDDMLIFLKAYKSSKAEGDFGRLRVPSEEFVHVIRVALAVFDKKFFPSIAENGIAQFLFSKIQSSVGAKRLQFFQVDESCRAHREFMISFFIRVNIFYKLKWVNNDARDGKKQKKRKRNGSQGEKDIKLLEVSCQ
ncbi:hypothetical protein QAD02_012734 [Eretmocerus hayati]|uniref:Uncharacterized protein n=1 Tax=Eretmocerus hayati TaxID=131215 RepID=A0ACC2P3D5_9HYME|nr:hypothetical protein QAD02_012734 [Eretmocerus hayati]